MKIITEQNYWETFTSVWESGNYKFEILQDSESVPSGYTDTYSDFINDLVLLDSLIKCVEKDYNFGYDLFVEAVSGRTFNNLSSNEKRIACDRLALRTGKEIDTNTIATYYVTNGIYTSDEVGSKIIKMVKKHRKNVAKCYDDRLEIAEEIAMDYLGTTDLADFANSIVNYEILAMRHGIVSMNHRDEIPGIIDWVDSTNAVTGLDSKGYTISEGKTIEELKADLKDAILYRLIF